MNLIERLDAVRARWNVLDHPFYLRWERGELERSELAFYAGEYRHAVVALADAAAADAVLRPPRGATPRPRGEVKGSPRPRNPPRRRPPGRRGRSRPDRQLEPPGRRRTHKRAGVSPPPNQSPFEVVMPPPGGGGL